MEKKYSIEDLEQHIIVITDELKEGITPGPDVPRDLLGTLHVNLLALTREARRSADKLATLFGFAPGASRTWNKPVVKHLLTRIEAAKGHQELLELALDALHIVGGVYGARESLKRGTLSKPLEESMREKALTDEQIEHLTLDVWEGIVIRGTEFIPGGIGKSTNPEHPHLINGYFQSDKYPTTPRGLVPLKCSDPAAQPLLWEYAELHRTKDAQFSDDLLIALKNQGYEHKETPFQAVVRLTIRLRGEMNCGRGDGELADHLRDELDVPWSKLSTAERDVINHLSAGLGVKP